MTTVGTRIAIHSTKAKQPRPNRDTRERYLFPKTFLLASQCAFFCLLGCGITDEGGQDTQAETFHEGTASGEPTQVELVLGLSASPQSGVIPLNVDFSNLSNQDSGDVLWDFGDGQRSTEWEPSHIYTVPGSYEVTLTLSTENETQKAMLLEPIVALESLDHGLVIEEVYAASTGEQSNFVDLLNATEQRVELGGIRLTDGLGGIYAFGSTDSLEAGERRTLFQDTSFFSQQDPQTISPFELSNGGGTLSLQYEEGSEGYSFEYPPGQNGQSWGLLTVSSGEQRVAPFFPSSPGAPNGQPHLGPLFISEIMYNPEGDGEDGEYVEILNVSDQSVDLAPSAELAWAFSDGIDYVFPQGAVIAAGEAIILAREPEAFSSGFAGSAGQIFGPYDGKLANGGELLELSQPILWGPEAMPLLVPLERVNFSDELPWPSQADGSGLSLQRLSGAAYGDDPIQWIASLPTPWLRSGSQSDPDIQLSEIMFNPLSSLASDEFIELTNVGTQSVDLSGWRLADGVELTIPELVLRAGERVVLAADVSSFEQSYGDDILVVGPWVGQLSNKGERIHLVNHAGVLVDEVRYADQGDWARRQRGPDDHGHNGWEWFAPADGDGHSLELLCESASNSSGQNWSPSVLSGGTPGLENSASQSECAPTISDVQHWPAIPHSQELVQIQARIDGAYERDSVEVFYRLDGTEEFVSQRLMDDGQHDDGEPEDGLFAGFLPAQENGSVVEFYIQANSESGLFRTWPGAVLGEETQLANALYLVQDAFVAEDWPSVSGQSLYHLILTGEEALELDQIGDGVDEVEGDVEHQSNAEMNATFISFDGDDYEVRYTVGVRNRGNGSRAEPPMNYKVNFVHDHVWDGQVSLNINSRQPLSQVAAAAVLESAGLVVAESHGVQLRVNGANLAEAEGNMYGAYAAVEPINSDYADAHFPEDRQGNLYRAYKQGYLLYEGESANSYKDFYKKHSNEDADDWQDLMSFTQALNDIEATDYFGSLEGHMDVEQWRRLLAMDSLIGNLEGGLTTGKGDDYGLYRGIYDTRFVLLPHDLDTCFGQGNSKADYDRSIYSYADVPGLKHLFTQAEFLESYRETLTELLAGPYQLEHIEPILMDVLEGWVPQDKIDEMVAHVEARIADVDRQLRAEHMVEPSAIWSFLADGSEPDAGWTTLGFDDEAWQWGAGELGYGDGDEATHLEDAESTKPITTYFRHVFDVDNPNDFDELRIRLLRDDGAVVYLNNEQVILSKMDDELPITSQTLATGSVSGKDEARHYEFIIGGEKLVAGPNILAVEIHQDSTDSSDLSFLLHVAAIRVE